MKKIILIAFLSVLSLIFSGCKDNGRPPKQAETEKEGEVQDLTSGTLKVRLTGQFESAIVGQKKYDAIGGSSSGISANKNSDVSVWITTKQNPKEKDWVRINEAGSSLSFTGSEIKMYPEGSGMKPLFNKIDSALLLQGIPLKDNTYKISVCLRDNQGREAESNEMPFRIFGTDTKLEDTMKPEYFKKDGSWDIEPWEISKFGGTNETITVPKELKRMFGSHTSGTYGALGYPINQGNPTTQTLIVEHDFKLINMKVLSSVNVVVKQGGKLNLQDCSVYGTVTVEKGGTFQMNYDTYNRKYETGAQINGRLILKEGSKIDHSLIYSNANNLTDGKAAHKIEDSVVLVTGKTTVIGKVYIRGDESPPGTSPTTHKLYAGQPAMLIEGGTVTIAENAELGLYGGGRNTTTTNGGTALFLKNGTVDGEGRLIAVGARAGSSAGESGHAVSGSGTIDVKEVWLKGGDSRNKDVEKGGGKALHTESSITVTDKPIGEAIDGGNPTPHPRGWDVDPAWWYELENPPDYKYETKGKPKIKK